jgi:hypothetical protein
MTTIVNLTPHSISLYNVRTGAYDSIAPSGTLARVSSATVSCGTVGDYALTATSYGVVEGLPNPQPDTIYVVSSLVAQRVSDRTDVFVPNESVRDEQGRIIGCKSLGRV